MSLQNIHSAMGSLAYAIAKADGVIQAQEKKIIKEIAQREFQLENLDIEWIEKMFVKLEQQNTNFEDAYIFAIDTLKANKFEFDFDNSVKNKCIQFMQRVAEAFNDGSASEWNLIERFQKDILIVLN